MRKFSFHTSLRSCVIFCLTIANIVAVLTCLYPLALRTYIRHRKSDLIVQCFVEKYRFGKTNFKAHSHLVEMRWESTTNTQIHTYRNEELPQCQLKRKRMWSTQVCLIIVTRSSKRESSQFCRYKSFCMLTLSFSLYAYLVLHTYNTYSIQFLLFTWPYRF